MRPLSRRTACGSTGLTPSTVYFFRVRSTDRSGNEASKPALPPGGPGVVAGAAATVLHDAGRPLHDTIVADFTAGTSTGTYVAETGDGELILAPDGRHGILRHHDAVRLVHDANGLPGGTATVGGGRLTVDGMRVATCDVGTPPARATTRRSSRSAPAPWNSSPPSPAKSSSTPGTGRRLASPAGARPRSPSPCSRPRPGARSRCGRASARDAPEVESDLGTSFPGVVGQLLGAPHRIPHRLAGEQRGLLRRRRRGADPSR